MLIITGRSWHKILLTWNREQCYYDRISLSWMAPTMSDMRQPMRLGESRILNHAYKKAAGPRKSMLRRDIPKPTGLRRHDGCNIGTNRP